MQVQGGGGPAGSKARLRIARVLSDELLSDVLLPAGAEAVARLASDLDSLGRLTADDRLPLVDEQTLWAMLRRMTSDAEATDLVDLLAALPGAALRPADERGTLPLEAPWLELASEVVIFDADPGAAISDLDLSGGDAVGAVQRRFPSMERELLEPNGVPVRLEEWLNGDQTQVLLAELVRQLGWWAALVGVLLMGTAHVSQSIRRTTRDPLADNVWPLSNFVLAAAIGGWTLTVVDSCALAPLERS